MAPLLFLLVLGASDLSRVFFYSTSVTNAAREGARHGAYFDPTAATPGNTFDNDASIFSTVTSEASGLSLTEPCHPNTSCAGSLTNCPSYPYASTLYPAAANTGYVFICFNDSAVATTAAIGQPIRVTILYSFQPVTPMISSMLRVAASTEVLAEGNN